MPIVYIITMKIVALILVASLVGFLLLHLRVRLHFSPEKKLLFIGLGRSGPELDFIRREAVISLWGWKVKRVTFDIKAEMFKKTPSSRKEKRAKAPPKAAPRRQRSLRDILHLLPKCFQPLWQFMIGVFKSVIVEELEGQIEGGFDSPHVTGMVFGYYQAALAAVPNVVGRVRFVPMWTEASLSGSARVAVAIPLYKLLGRMIVLLFRLPLRDLFKLAIGKKKGVSDVQQSR